MRLKSGLIYELEKVVLADNTMATMDKLAAISWLEEERKLNVYMEAQKTRRQPAAGHSAAAEGADRAEEAREDGI